MGSIFKKGQYYCAKYDGINGDLLLGQIKSVRSSGDVLLVNLLTGNTATKKASILAQRNKRICKRQADEVLSVWKKTKSKKKVRSFVLDLYPFEGYKKTKMLDDVPETRTVEIEEIQPLERIANALEKIVEYMGNMRIG